MKTDRMYAITLYLLKHGKTSVYTCFYILMNICCTGELDIGRCEGILYVQ